MPVLSADCRLGEDRATGCLQEEFLVVSRRSQGAGNNFNGPRVVRGFENCRKQANGFGYRNWHCRKTDSASFRVITRTFMRYL
jgi:hypothetical protein